MEVKVESKTEQPLLSRTVLRSRVSFEAATPSRAEIKKKISEAVKAEESLVHIIMIKTDFGQKASTVTAHVYKSKEKLERYAAKRVKDRHLSKEEREKLKAANVEGGK